jgi:UDP-N-acetylglucosamine--N-acetylmuramyl-(pentapeptide) pyrophosphoryl-undecaprenol N-acetylglucosamine transferase
LKENRPLNILLAGGGTGGHLFPGIAVAQCFKTMNPKHDILFVGSGRYLEASVLSRLGFACQRIDAYGIKGMGWEKILRSLMSLPAAFLQSARIIHRFRPDILIGLGGYSSGPLIVTAGFMGIKTVLMEQNTVPGITNRLLSCMVDRIYVAFEHTRFHCTSSKIRCSGNPVRKEIAGLRSQKGRVSGRPFTVLILGGSQGAHSINRAMTEALKHLENLQNFYFIHQTGNADRTWVTETYKQSKAQFQVQAFYMDMASLYAKADLIICRAGATTIAEITAAGKPAVFIPYPFAADNHQTHNAMVLVKANAAKMIVDAELSGKSIAEQLDYFKHHPRLLSRMAANAGQQGKINAAYDIANDCSRMVS